MLTYVHAAPTSKLPTSNLFNFLIHVLKIALNSKEKFKHTFFRIYAEKSEPLLT